MKGLPWDPKGRGEVSNLVRTGDALTAGANVRGAYITDKILDKYGRTNGCPKCEGLLPSTLFFPALFSPGLSKKPQASNGGVGIA